MKILHVCEAYGGGVYTILNQLAIGQAALGHEVHLAVALRPQTPENWQYELPATIRTHKLELGREINPVQDLRGTLQIISLIKSIRPDILHLHSSKAGFAGRLAARLAGYAGNTFYSPHAFAFLAPDSSAKKRKAYYLLEKLGARFGGILVACSQDELDVAQKMGIHSTLVNNAIDLAELHAATDVLSHEPSDRIRIVSAGRVCAHKRPELFVATAEECLRRGLPVDFTWIGGGEPFPNTTAATCLGWQPREAVLGLLKTVADIYLQTSAYEGLPVSVLEAQALGLPAVVADAVGNRSAVQHGVTGCVVADPTPAYLADSIEALVKSPNLREAMGQAAKARIAAEFDTPLMVARYLYVYESHLKWATFL